MDWGKPKEEMTEEQRNSVELIEKALKECGDNVRKELEEKIKELKSEIANGHEEDRKKREAEEGAKEEKKKKADESRDGKIEEVSKLIAELQKTVGELAGEVGEQKKKSASFEIKKKGAFRESLDEAINSEKFQEFAKGDFSKKSGKFALKGISQAIKYKGVVSQTSNLTTANGTAFAYQSEEVIPEVNVSRPSMRSLIPTIDASDEEFTSWGYQQIVNINRNAAAVSENGELPEGSFDVKEVLAETHRIGWHLPISKRLMKRKMLGDYIAQLLPSGMTQQENFQILYGDDQSSNWKGIVKFAPTESVITSAIYTEATAGKVKSIESWDNGASTKINFVHGYAKIESGMTFTGSGFQTATGLNSAKTLTKYNDSSIIVPVSYVAETDASVLANAKFTITNAFAASVPNANIGDAISIALAYLMFGTYVPTAIVMNPVDYASFTSIKDVNGRRMFGDYVTVTNGIPYFGGIYPIVLMPDIVKGNMLIGDFQRGAKLIDTQAGELEFAEDVTTKLKNTVESIIQEETILEVSVPQAFMYANISNLISSITTPNTAVANVNVANQSLAVNSTIVGPLTSDGEVKVKSL